MDLRENLVVCIGSPMIDITARVPYEFLQKYKLKSNNATSYNEDYSKIFDDLQEYGPTTSVGGSITNTVISIQNSLSVPGVCCYLGAIGNDDYGKEIRRNLISSNVKVLFEEIAFEQTGKCAVMLYEDNRSFVTDLGASAYLSNEFIDRNDVQLTLAKAKYYYLSAFFLRISYDIIKKICEHSNMEKKIFIFNIGAPFLCRHYSHEFKEILAYVNVLIGNEEEFIQLADILNCGKRDVKQIASFLYKKCRKMAHFVSKETLVIMTRGEKSIIVASKNGVITFGVPHFKTKGTLNTNGAGDCFVGGFLANYIQNKPVSKCIRGGIQLSLKYIKEKSIRFN